MSATGVRSQTLSLHPSRDIAEAALAAILEHSGASVSIINADDGDGFLVQDLVNDESAVKVSVDFSGADATCPIIIRGPSAEARASYDRISRVVMQTEQEQSAREQLLPEKLTARRQTPATDGSLHFRLDVDERFVDPPASHRRQPQGPRESLGANPKPGFDQSLEDIRNHGRDYSVENDSGSNDEMSYSAEGDSIGGFENHRHSFALNSTLRSRQGASFQQRTSRADKPPLRPPRQVSPPRQHGGAKISSYQLSKVLAKLKAQSYELGGVNMTAEFQRADTSGTGYLSRADFGRTLRRLVRLQQHELEYVFELFDGNGNDVIEYREFVQFMLQHGEEAARQIATAEKINRAHRASGSSPSRMDDGAPVQKSARDDDFFNELYQNQQDYRYNAETAGDPRLFVKGFGLGIPPEDDDDVEGHSYGVSDQGDPQESFDSRPGNFVHRQPQFSEVGDDSSHLTTHDDDDEISDEVSEDLHHRATVPTAHGASAPRAHTSSANESQLKWLNKNVQQLTVELEQLKEQKKHEKLLYDAGKKEVDMARQLCADLRNKLVEAHKQRHQHENKIYQSDQIIRRLTKNVETSKVLLSKVHEQCEVWKEQAALSQKNLETLKLRSSEEIEELRKTLNDERQKWKDAESNYELDILRMRDEKASAIREKNVVIADLHNEIADTHNDHKFELKQMEEKMHLVEQAKGMSESAWAAKTDKLVQQYKREADDARAQADRRLQDLTAHQTRATDAAEAASRREAGLGNRIEELEKENNDLRKQLQRLKDSSQAKIAQLVTDRKQRTTKMWGLLSKSVKLRGIVETGFGFARKRQARAADAEGSVHDADVPEEGDFSCPSEFEDENDGEDPQKRMIATMEKNVAEIERTKLAMANTEAENEILRNRNAQLELQYGMQSAAIKALRLATMAAKLREKESVKRSCVDHLQMKDMQITIEKLHQKISSRRGSDNSASARRRNTTSRS